MLIFIRFIIYYKRGSFKTKKVDLYLPVLYSLRHPRGHRLLAIVGKRSWIIQIISDEVLCSREYKQWRTHHIESEEPRFYNSTKWSLLLV